MPEEVKLTEEEVEALESDAEIQAISNGFEVESNDGLKKTLVVTGTIVGTAAIGYGIGKFTEKVIVPGCKKLAGWFKNKHAVRKEKKAEKKAAKAAAKEVKANASK